MALVEEGAEHQLAQTSIGIVSTPHLMRKRSAQRKSFRASTKTKMPADKIPSKSVRGLIHQKRKVLAFPLDSLGRVVRTLGGNPQQARILQHTRAHAWLIGWDSIRNHFRIRDLLSWTFCGGSKSGV